jgi:hypothetical protein
MPRLGERIALDGPLAAGNGDDAAESGIRDIVMATRTMIDGILAACPYTPLQTRDLGDKTLVIEKPHQT